MPSVCPLKSMVNEQVKAVVGSNTVVVGNPARVVKELTENSR